LHFLLQTAAELQKLRFSIMSRPTKARAALLSAATRWTHALGPMPGMNGLLTRDTQVQHFHLNMPKTACKIDNHKLMRYINYEPLAGKLASPWGAGTTQGCTSQISFAYSAIVLSDENLPLPAVDIMDMRVHLALSLYVSSTLACIAQANGKQ